MDLQKFRWLLSQHPIAYMSAEFGLEDRLPIYSGGLGILAGDIIRAANDMELPFIGVGLLYKEGYFQQLITKHGQSERYPRLNMTAAPVNLIVDSHGEPIKVNIPVEEHLIHFQVWEYCEGDVSVYLLDTDVPENNQEHRTITQHLYGGDKTNRILQEIVLGIGGAKTLRELHIHPSIFHLNEGHSAFGILEIAHHYMTEYKWTFEKAYEYAKSKIVFTNHTLVAAGNEVFDNALVDHYLESYMQELKLPNKFVLDQGKLPGEDGKFSMTQFALNLAVRSNAVSQLHGTLAQELWPGKDIVGITNGVHLPTWVSADLKAQAPKFDISKIHELPEASLWRLHEMAKYRLRDEVKYRTGVEIDMDTMIVSWARRFASYKRPEALFEDMQRLKDIIFHAHHPVQILLAGKAHPNDDKGRNHIISIIEKIHEFGLDKHVILVPDYNMKLADVMISGSDVWLNTPILGREACGTSGMKAAANGVLQCSVSDGWVAEIDVNEGGWEIHPEDTSNSMYTLLEEKISPLFYERDDEGIPVEWVKRMKSTIETAWTSFSARRMLEDYVDVLYRPTLEMESKQRHHHYWRRRYLTKRG